MIDNTPTDSTASESAASEDARDEPPRFSVVRGNPTDSELAAVTAVVTAMAEESGKAPTAKPVRNAWAHSQRGVRRAIAPGAGAWNRQNV